MTRNELILFLEFHPEYELCPACGGAGERVFPVRGKVVECQRCEGEGVVLKEGVKK